MRISALRCSTVAWAFSIALVTMRASIGTSSGSARSITQLIAPGGEDPHQLVLEREVEPALARVALAARAAAQLVVDAPALVALAAEHVEPAELEHLLGLLGTARRRDLASSSW